MILKDFFQEIKSQFQKTEIESYALDARLLFCHALDISLEKFVLSNDRELTLDEIARITSFVELRLSGMPVAKITGQKEFYGRIFKTTIDTLDPRPDSEILIEAILATDFRSKDDVKILDLGTGTGCLVLTLLAEMPLARAIAVDQSVEALSVAKENAWKIGVEDRVVFAPSDWFNDVIGSFDIIVSNPPYIPENDIPGLSREVRLFDPISALTGGADGLDPYRIIIPQLTNFLKPGGLAVFELGQGQAQDIAGMLTKAGFSNIFVNHDLGGIARVVGGFQLQNVTDPVR